ncbi:MAG: alpha-L-fucosidase [Sporolactobacillus sp.]
MFSEKEEYHKKMKWYVDARFGMFLHWGLYAIPGRGEWVRSDEYISEQEYKKYFNEFNPEHYDPVSWAKVAKSAGMQYVILTAKHHDGFCLFDSQYTNYKSTKTPLGRDIVREFVDAMRAEGLRVGLYYSLLDWHHEDYPHYGDRYHPMRVNSAYTNEQRDFRRYLLYMHHQIRELCTNYGKLDILWFDFSYDKMRGEAWEASKLVRMIHSLQPDVIINNRLEVSGEGVGSLATKNPTPFHGDFVSPEQIIPPFGVRDNSGEPLIWEACMTMNGHWGFCANDHFFKPAEMMIRKLVECVSKGGNMLLNIGPDANGYFPVESLNILKAFSRWMKKNDESIYGCGPSGLNKPEYGRVTKKGSNLYYHIFENTIGPLPLYGLKNNQIKSIRWLATNAEIPVSTSWVHSDYPNVPFANLGPDPVLSDSIDTVIKVEIDK